MAHYLVDSRRRQTARRNKGKGGPRPNNPDFWGLPAQIKSLSKIAKEHGFNVALKKGVELQQYWRDAQGAKETHAAMIGKTDAFLLDGDYLSAKNWSEQAYKIAPNEFTALKYIGVLYALKDFETVKSILDEYLSDSLSLENPKGKDRVFLSMYLAIQHPQHDLTWIKFYTDNTMFGDSEKIIGQLINNRDKFRQVHQLKDDLDANERAVLGKDRDKARIARKIIAAYSGAGFVWDTLHERIAASNQVATAASTKGFISKHQPPEPPVAAGPVRHIKLG